MGGALANGGGGLALGRARRDLKDVLLDALPLGVLCHFCSIASDFVRFVGISRDLCYFYAIS